MSISVQSKITVAAENGPKFLTALKPVFDNVATNPACTYSEVFQDTQNPGTFRFIQNWNCTKEDLKENQLKKDYYQDFLSTTEPLYVKPRELEVWDRLPGHEYVRAKKENFMD